MPDDPPTNANAERDAVGSDEDMHSPTGSLAGGVVRRNWEESFHALAAFKEKFGNCLVPSHYEDDSALGHWVRKQRRNEASGTLTPEKREKLDALGFTWKLRGDQYANAAQQRHIRTGSKPKLLPHAGPPTGARLLPHAGPPTGGAKPPPGTKPRKPSPPPDATTATTTPTTRNAATKKRNWAESYDALVKYQKKHGHCNVPRRYPPDLPLGQWVSKQRFQKATLTKKQREKLEAIGFNFVLRKERHQRLWEEKLERLRAYKRSFGDCDVPYAYGDDLGRWVAEQRKAYAEDRLSPDHVTALEAVGLVLDQDNEPAMDEESEYEEGAPLHGKSSSRPHSKPRFTLSEKWEIQFDNLARFYRQYGHCVVPRNIDTKLAYWTQRQRVLNAQNKLKEERKEMLDDLNFEWYYGINPLPAHYFDEMMQRLTDFQQTQGHADVPRSYKRGGLGDWLHKIKSQGRDGLLEPVEAARLLPLGFTWMENREAWFRNFEDVAFEVSNSRRSDSDLSLSSEMESWLKVQFMLLEYDLIPPKREAKLQSLGLVWDGENFSWKEVGINQDATAGTALMLDDDISTGLDLKDAAISWTPDRSVARKSTNESNDSPVVRMDIEEEDKTEAGEVAPEPEEEKATDEKLEKTDTAPGTTVAQEGKATMVGKETEEGQAGEDTKKTEAEEEKGTKGEEDLGKTMTEAEPEEPVAEADASKDESKDQPASVPPEESTEEKDSPPANPDDQATSADTPAEAKDEKKREAPDTAAKVDSTSEAAQGESTGEPLPKKAKVAEQVEANEKVEKPEVEDREAKPV